jgi:hypothetical protein
MTPTLMNTALQVVIVLTGLIGLYGALNWSGIRHTVAIVIAICGQPAWLFVTFFSEQYGMFSLAVIYTGIWVQALIADLREQGYF